MRDSERIFLTILKWYQYYRDENEEKCQLGLLVDPMPIFPNQHHKNCVADSQENY